MNDRIRDRFFNEAFSKLFKEGQIRNLSSSGYSLSGNEYNFSIPPNEYFNLTDKHEIVNSETSHFTSLRGLFSILNSESIRLYNLCNLNDPTEYSYALPNKYKYDLERKKEGIYILSTCLYNDMTESEKFSMWNNYGENGFGARLILEYNEGKKWDLNSTFFKKVLYNKFDLSDFIRAKELIENEEAIYPINFLDTVKTPCILHKNEQYENEREVRLVYLNEHDDNQVFNSSDPECPYFMEYSYTSKKFCRYYNLKLNDSDSFANVSIKKIILGPKHNPESEIVEKLKWMCLAKSKRIKQPGVFCSNLELAAY